MVVTRNMMKESHVNVVLSVGNKRLGAYNQKE